LPQVASDTQAHAASHPRPHAPRANRGQERTPAASFESMVDANAAAANDRSQEPESQPKTARKSSTPAANKSEPVKSSKSADETDSNQADQTGDADQTTGTEVKDETTGSTKDTKPKDAKSKDAKPGKQPDEIVKPVDGSQDADPSKTDDASTDKAPAPAVPVAVTASTPSPAPVPAPPAVVSIPPQGAAPATETESEPKGIQPPVVAQTGDGAPQVALAGPKDAPAKDGDNKTPDGQFDVKADAAARNAPPADVAHRGADKPAPDMTLAPPKPGTDAPQPLTITTPAPQTTAPTASNAASAPPPQPPAQPVAVPLAGVAIEIASKALAGKNHFAIRLDPPELGRIEVHLDVHRDGRVTSHLVADRKDTLDFFRRDAAGLERALQDAGLKTSDNGLQFSLRDQQNAWQQQQQQQQQANSANSVRLVADDGLPAIDATQTGVRLSYRSGGLDIRV
jgi:hypothetical protein